MERRVALKLQNAADNVENLVAHIVKRATEIAAGDRLLVAPDDSADDLVHGFVGRPVGVLVGFRVGKVLVTFQNQTTAFAVLVKRVSTAFSAPEKTKPTHATLVRPLCTLPNLLDLPQRKLRLKKREVRVLHRKYSFVEPFLNRIPKYAFFGLLFDAVQLRKGTLDWTWQAHKGGSLYRVTRAREQHQPTRDDPTSIAQFPGSRPDSVTCADKAGRHDESTNTATQRT